MSTQSPDQQLNLVASGPVSPHVLLPLASSSPKAGPGKGALAVTPSKRVRLPALFLDTKDCHQQPGLYEQEHSQEIDGSDKPTLLGAHLTACRKLC